MKQQPRLWNNKMTFEAAVTVTGTDNGLCP